MPETTFKILGTEVAPMLGRRAELERVISSLSKDTPNHLSIVGPRYCGKTVFLNRVFEDLGSDDSQFDAVDLWDLGHQTPMSDEAFIEQLKDRLADALKGTKGGFDQLLEAVDGGDYAEVEEVIQCASRDGLKVLMLWDGFDKPLHSGLLTRNLWDQLREIAMLPGFCLVTASRLPLHDLLRSKDAATSDFWGIFESVHKLGCFNEQDCDSVLEKVADLKFNKGARTELENWTAAYPPLHLCVLNQLAATTSDKTVDSAAVCAAAENVDEAALNIIRDLWDECSAQTQDLYRSIAADGPISAAGIPREPIETLAERGFVQKSGNKYQTSCRLLHAYLGTEGNSAAGLGHLFGSWEDYRRNIRRMLEHRLSQINNVDQSLFRLVSKAIDDIPDYPEHCLNNLTFIEEEALDAIWSIEFGQDKIFEQGYWDTLHWVDRNNSTVIELKEHADRPIPRDRLLQLKLLRLLTGSQAKFSRQSKFATKDMYVLVDAIHSFRNRTQHAEGEKMGLGVAVSALMLCVELLGCIDKAQRC